MITLVYLVIGIVLANSHNYLENLKTLEPILSAALAIVLWPLLLLGINLHVNL